MFNLQGSELIIILLLALVVLGPEKLPDAMRKAGQFYAELKKMSTGFQSEFRAAVEEPLRELRETANTIRDSADFTKLQSGERAEKPKSAEMVAPADPDAVPSEDLPFQPGPDAEVDNDPADSRPADVAPGDQEPFASVVLTNRAADRSAHAEASTDPAMAEPSAPKAFSGTQVSSAGPPIRVSAPVGPPDEDDGSAAPGDGVERPDDASGSDVGGEPPE